MLVGAHPIPRPFNPAMLNGPKVQLGAFAQLRQANAVWKAAVKAHPPLGQIQPAIIQNRAWNGQAFYQFEIGTNSVADAQLLCQWMARANFRCTVVAPPWTRR